MGFFKSISKLVDSLIGKDPIETNLTDGVSFEVTFKGEFSDEGGNTVEYKDTQKLVRGKQILEFSATELKEFQRMVKETPKLRKELNLRLLTEKR